MGKIDPVCGEGCFITTVQKSDHKKIKQENNIPFDLPTPTKGSQTECPLGRKNGQPCLYYSFEPFQFRSDTRPDKHITDSIREGKL